jgi:NAD-dependent dihydropyrimidine dehydrogenase PreA subunit
LGPLGSNGETGGEALVSGLKEIRKLVPYIKLEKKEKLARRLEKREDYDELYTPEEIERLLQDVSSYYIDPHKCQACMICYRKCPVEAIAGGKNRIHVIDQQICIKCGTCFEACPPRFAAVNKIVGEPVPPPLPEEQRTIVRKAQRK